MLGLEPEKTIYDLVVAPGELDPRSSPATRRSHRRARRPPAPLRPEDAELVTEAKLGRLLEVARELVRRDRRRHVAVLPRADAGDARPHRRAARALRLDVPTLKNVRLALQTLELLSFPTQRIASSSTAPTRRSG
jgi:hypothetical protein